MYKQKFKIPRNKTYQIINTFRQWSKKNALTNPWWLEVGKIEFCLIFIKIKPNSKYINNETEPKKFNSVQILIFKSYFNFNLILIYFYFVKFYLYSEFIYNYNK